jgi:MobA/MobL family
MALNLIVPQIISRKDGKSVIAKAAYNARAQLRDERTGELKDYSKVGGLEWQGVFLDPNRKNPELSEWMKDRQQLYNAYERKADQSTRPNDAQLAREFLITLPHELSADQRRMLITDFSRELSRQGLIVDVSIHRPDRDGDERNHHAHMLLGMYRIDEQTGQLSAKKERAWNKKEWYQKVHERWSELGARYLERAGFELEAERFRVGHLPRDQQIDMAEKRGDLAHADDLRNREPGKHLGPHVSAMERKGIETDLGNAQRGILERNEDRATLHALKRELASLDRQDALDLLKHEFAETQKRLMGKHREAERGNTGGATEKEPRREAEREAPAKTQPAKTRYGDTLMQRAAQTALRDPHQREGDPNSNVAAFRAALERHKLALARATPEEAAKSYREAKFAKEVGRTAPVYQPGEIVVVREPGLKQQRSGEPPSRVHKLDPARAEQYLKWLRMDKEQLQGIEATKSMLDDRAQKRGLGRATGPRRGGLVAHQMWALRRAYEAERQRREQEGRIREADAKQKRNTGNEIDAERYRLDPEYRRQVQDTQAWKSPEDKKRDRENAARALLEQQDRGR